MPPSSAVIATMNKKNDAVNGSSESGANSQATNTGSG